MPKNTKYSKYCEMITQLDQACSLIHEYDSLLHDYNGVILYQAESQLIKLIGSNPGISAAECARILKKTLSACSQLLKKLRNKGFIRQDRNEQNNRVYNLYLTSQGEIIYENHKQFEEKCYQRTFQLLNQFSELDFDKCIQMLELVNKGFQLDIEDSRKLTEKPD